MTMIDSYILKNNKKYTFEEWKTDYTSYLERLYELPDEAQKNPYNDPDAISTKNELFYIDLASFLNNQEQSVLNNEWSYEAIFGKTVAEYGIQVSYKNGKELFVLFSDQFGFSAPNPKKNHPYDYYVKLAKVTSENHYRKAISNVTEWIFNTRSIGGSFLWPRQVQAYNISRGGSENRSSYIQDRVDLTLLEIKHIFDKAKTESDILYKHWKGSQDLQEFFKHFGSFETYIKFFKMDDFVGENLPIDIITGKELTKDIIKKYRNKEEGIFTLDIYEIEQMLFNVNEMTGKRTSKMQA